MKRKSDASQGTRSLGKAWFQSWSSATSSRHRKRSSPLDFAPAITYYPATMRHQEESDDEMSDAATVPLAKDDDDHYTVLIHNINRSTYVAR